MFSSLSLWILVLKPHPKSHWWWCWAVYVKSNEGQGLCGVGWFFWTCWVEEAKVAVFKAWGYRFSTSHLRFYLHTEQFITDWNSEPNHTLPWPQTLLFSIQYKMHTFPVAWTPALFLPPPSSIYQAKPHKTPQPTTDIMVTISPFEKLPIELTTMIINGFESPRDIQAVISADSHMLRHFVANRRRVLRRFQNTLKDGFIGTNISIALKACRLRRIEKTFPGLDRIQISRRVESALRSPQDQREGRRPVWQLSLETISPLLELLSESNMFVDDYSSEAWDQFQELTHIDVDHEITLNCHNPMPRVPLLLSGSEDFWIQRAYLLFDAFWHTLWFDISVLRNTTVIQVSVCNNSEARWKDSDWGTRAFQSVYRFIFQRYKRLMYRACSTQQFRSSLRRDVYENFH